MPNYVLLLGAGFSRNWGGWLAAETFEYLLGCPQINEGVRSLLWKYRRSGGFESALAEAQEDFERNKNASTEDRLRRLEDAIAQMFSDMDKAFANLVNFEFQVNVRYLVQTCFVRFDAIFTLNQDLLMERRYLAIPNCSIREV